MKVFKYLIAALLIPLAIGFSKAFYTELSNLIEISVKLHFFIWGLVIYMLMHILFFKPTYLYILGHEVIHVLATWICGGHVTSFNISKWGGKVTTSKTNFFIELGPYFVPAYTVFLILLIPIIKNKFITPKFFSFYIFSLGFTLAMHLIMTAEALKMKQTDLLRSGYAFSLIFVYFANLIIVFFMLSIFTATLSFKSYFFKSLGYSKSIYISVWDRLF